MSSKSHGSAAKESYKQYLLNRDDSLSEDDVENMPEQCSGRHAEERTGWRAVINWDNFADLIEAALERRARRRNERIERLAEEYLKAEREYRETRVSSANAEERSSGALTRQQGWNSNGSNLGQNGACSAGFNRGFGRAATNWSIDCYASGGSSSSGSGWSSGGRCFGATSGGSAFLRR